MAPPIYSAWVKNRKDAFHRGRFARIHYAHGNHFHSPHLARFSVGGKIQVLPLNQSYCITWGIAPGYQGI